MVVEVKKYGRFFLQDDQGYLINDCDIAKIVSPWADLVQQWQGICRDVLGDDLISIYIRGSIPRGLAVEGVSDLDGIAVIRALDDDLLAQKKAKVRSHSNVLKKQFPFCQKIETQIITEKKLFDSGYFWTKLLKIQALHLWGKNYDSQLPPVTIDSDLVAHAFYLKESIRETCYLFRNYPLDDETIKQKCTWLCRRLVRSGFELVMLEKQLYTRDLYLNYEVFSQVFPHKKEDMYRALFLALNPSNNRAGLLIFWQEFGHWLTTEIDKKYQLLYD